jgi:glycosyltransferase involved in cell wall biosynthesis
VSSSSYPITVLVTVFNGSRYVGAAIESILTQSVSDFELLIIDDASTDESREVISRYKDPRIRFIRQEVNQGIHATLNRGLVEASAPLLAIMDQDDISLPNRLATQLTQFAQNSRLAVLGSAIEIFGENPGESWVRHFHPEALKVALLFENPICHPSVMMNRAELMKRKLNYPNFPLAEEYALWVQTSRGSEIANHPATLLRYRAHSQQVSRTRNLRQVASNDLVMVEQLHHLGLKLSARDLMVHKLLSGGFNPLPDIAGKTQHWITRLIAANTTTKIYDPEHFRGQLETRRLASINRHQEGLRIMPLWRQLRWRSAVWLDYLKAHKQPL